MSREIKEKGYLKKQRLCLEVQSFSNQLLLQAEELWRDLSNGTFNSNI